jgi:hypothetical protein
MRALLLCSLVLSACGESGSVKTSEEQKKTTGTGASNQAPDNLFPSEEEGDAGQEPTGPRPPIVLGQVFYTKAQLGGPSRLTRLDLGTRVVKDMAVNAPDGVGGLITCEQGLVTWAVVATGVTFTRDSDKRVATAITPCTGTTVGVYPTSSGDLHASGFECDDGSKQVVVINALGEPQRTVPNAFEPLLKSGANLFFTRSASATTKSLHATPADQSAANIVDVTTLPVNATYDVSADLQALVFNAESSASGTRFTRFNLSTGATATNSVSNAAPWPFALSADGEALLVSLTRASDSALLLGLAVFTSNDSWLLRDNSRAAIVLERDGGLYWINKNASF